MGDEHGVPDNAIGRLRNGAIAEWDTLAQRHARAGNNYRALGAWSMKQLARAAPESWGGLAVHVALAGSGLATRAAVRGIQATRLAAASERLLAASKVPFEAMGKLRVFRVGGGSVLALRPGALARLAASSTRLDKGLAIAGAAAAAWTSHKVGVSLKQLVELGHFGHALHGASHQSKSTKATAPTSHKVGKAALVASPSGAKKLAVQSLPHIKLSHRNPGRLFAPHRPALPVPKLHLSRPFAPVRPVHHRAGHMKLSAPKLHTPPHRPQPYHAAASKPSGAARHVMAPTPHRAQSRPPVVAHRPAPMRGRGR